MTRKAPHVFVGDHPGDACRVCGDPQAPATPYSREGLHIPAGQPARVCEVHGYAAGEDGCCLACPDPRPIPMHVFVPRTWGDGGCFCGQPEDGPRHVPDPDPRCGSHGTYLSDDGTCWHCLEAAR